jgi:Domain of unknown function (DUF4150)/GHH signature containing HNH/Endo VII superfamily nuclease toxin  2
MSNQVYANGMEISCKSADGKSICAFPDVCFTPPLTPATPPGVPIPYPNTGMASDCTSGSTTVKISGNEVMLKNKSYFKRSTGDEAGAAPKKGVLTSVNMGKVYFNAWSMDVMVEGENAVRNLDLTTHNHASAPGDTGPWPYLDEVALPGIEKTCEADKKKEQQACNGCKNPCPPYQPPKSPKPSDTSIGRRLAATINRIKGIQAKSRTSGQKSELKIANKAYKDSKEYKNYRERNRRYFNSLAKKTASEEYKCAQARRCMLVPYKPGDKDQKCCPGQTPHHLIEASAFLVPGSRGKGDVLRPEFENSKYDLNKAPCICVEGQNNTAASHGLMHTYQGVRARKVAVDGRWTNEQATECAGASVNMVFPDSKCGQACIEAQLKAYHEQEKVGIKPKQKIPASPSGKSESAAAEKSWADYDKLKATKKATSKKTTSK